MLKKLAMLFLLAAAPAAAQNGNALVIPFNGPPTGSCAFIMFARDITTDSLYSCGSAGNWVAVVNGTSVGSDIIPAADITYTLGNSSVRWLNVFSQTGTFSFLKAGSGTLGDTSGALIAVPNNTVWLSIKKNGSGSCDFGSNTSNQVTLNCPLAITGGQTLGFPLVAGDASSPSNGDAWYNTSTGKFRARQNGATVDMIGGNGHTPQTGYYLASTLAGNCGNSIVDGQMVQTIAGSGTITSIAPPVANWVGGCSLNTASSTTGRASWATQTSGGVSRIVLLGGGTWDQTWYLRSGANLSDGTDTYRIHIGFQESFSTATPADGVFFRYIHSVNSGNWTCVHANGSTETTADSTVAYAVNTNYTLRITVNADASATAFYINGTQVCGSMAQTNIPKTSGHEVGWGAMILKSAGTNSRNVNMRAIILDHVFTTSW